MPPPRDFQCPLLSAIANFASTDQTQLALQEKELIVTMLEYTVRMMGYLAAEEESSTVHCIVISLPSLIVLFPCKLRVYLTRLHVRVNRDFSFFFHYVAFPTR